MGVHHARKAIRSTRALLKLTSAELGPGADALNYLLQVVNQSLSSLRDAQALVEATDHFAAKTRSKNGLALLDRARSAAVTCRRQALQRAIAFDRRFTSLRERILAIQTALPELAWHQVTPECLTEAFSETKQKTRKAAVKAGASSDDEFWHQWRRTARRQSQQHKLLAEINIRTKVRYDDKAIAVLLGKQQDCALLLDFAESGHSPLRWADRIQLREFMHKHLRTLRRELASHDVHR